ncbi:hypothetical protein COLO4_13394 [Corchorus olitorius]|uniref:Nudix hydrolase domain-containing protein n=1 Tax=Corchorus olitorius TaxID=93759 RepID=A0A1R3JWL5_9ROSI|nr:hypothetical protein COLO4_13394 [Corchorus olitorius]
MSEFLARTGRDRQRYDENNFRLVSGCIPYRLTKDDKEDIDMENRVEVLMISSPNRSDLVFPKGGWEDDETVVEAACREALEEAGVRGILRDIPLGVWEFRSKSRQDLCSLEGSCRGYMFALQVTEELDIWPEQNDKQRIWLNVKQAFQLCRYDWMRRALEEFLKVIIAQDDDDKLKLKEQMEIVDEPQPPSSDHVVADCQIMASNCYVKPSKSQHHAHALTAIPCWHISLKRLPLI